MSTPTACKYCKQTDLLWEKDDKGRWMLTGPGPGGKRHICSPPPKAKAKAGGSTEACALLRAILAQLEENNALLRSAIEGKTQ